MGVGAMAEIGTIGQLLITFLFELITFIILLGDLAVFFVKFKWLVGWQSGRMRRSRTPLYSQEYREFESHPHRQFSLFVFVKGNLSSL